jgi:hypothetical protein
MMMVNCIEHSWEPKRLFLAWQPPEVVGDRFRWAVALLDRCADPNAIHLRYFNPGLEFESFNQGRQFEQLVSLGYEGYPAFSRTRAIHDHAVTDALMRRLPPRSRPDFSDYMKQFRLVDDLGLSDFALLGRTEAKVLGDGFSVVDPLDADTQEGDLLLEIAGYRHYARGLVFRLSVGDRIDIVPEPGNRHDGDAVQVMSRGQKIGNINRLQAKTFLRWTAKRDIQGVIERLNGSPDHPRAFIFVRVRAMEMRAAA